MALTGGHHRREVEKSLAQIRTEEDTKKREKKIRSKSTASDVRRLALPLEITA
jgi:hypothetical protein